MSLRWDSRHTLKSHFKILSTDPDSLVTRGRLFPRRPCGSGTRRDTCLSLALPASCPSCPHPTPSSPAQQPCLPAQKFPTDAQLPIKQRSNLLARNWARLPLTFSALVTNSCGEGLLKSPGHPRPPCLSLIRLPRCHQQHTATTMGRASPRLHQEAEGIASHSHGRITLRETPS